MICCEDKKSFPKSSQGRPPVPDGLAHNTIVSVPPDLGVTSLGDGVGDVDGVVAVLVTGAVVVVDGVPVTLETLVVVVVCVCPEEQPANAKPITSSTMKRAIILFIFKLLGTLFRTLRFITASSRGYYTSYFFNRAPFA